MISKSNSLYFLCEMKKHIDVLESLKAEDRLKSIKETEFHFKVCKDQLPSIKQNLNKSYITMKNNLYKLHILQVMIEDWEKKHEMFDDSPNSLQKEKLTHYEYDMKKQELKIEAKRRKIAFDDLLDHTLCQYNMYKRFLINYEEEKANFKEFLKIMKKIENFLREAFNDQNTNLEKVNEQQTFQFVSTDKLNEEKYEIPRRISQIENVDTNDKSCITSKIEDVINTKSKTSKIKNNIKFHSKTKHMKKIKLKNDKIITEFKKSNLNSKNKKNHKKIKEFKKIESDLSVSESHSINDVSQENNDEKRCDITQNNDGFHKETEVLKNEHSEKQDLGIHSTNNFEISNFSEGLEEHYNNLQEKKDLNLKRNTNLKRLYNNDSQLFEKNTGDGYFSDNETAFLESNQSNNKKKLNTYKNKHKFSNFVNKFIFGYPYSLKEKNTKETLLYNSSENIWKNNSFYLDKERDVSHLFVAIIDSTSIYLDENKIYQKKKENQYKYDRNFPKIININKTNNNETNNNETQIILDDEKQKEAFEKIKAKKYKQMKCEEENRLILKKRYLEEMKKKDLNKNLIKNPNEKQAYNISRRDPENMDAEKDNRKQEEGTIKRNKIIYDYRKLLKENQVCNNLSDPYSKNKMHISKSTETDYDKQNVKESNSGEVRSNELDNNLNFEILDTDLKYDFSKEYKSKDDSRLDENEDLQKIDKSNSVENNEIEKSKKSAEEILVDKIDGNEIKSLDAEAENIKDQKKVDKPKVINNIDEPSKSNTKSTPKQEKMSFEEISNTLDIQESQKNINPTTDNKLEDDGDIFQEYLDQSPTPEDLMRVICSEKEVEIVQEESDKIHSSESSDDQKPLEEEMSNSKLWKKNCYFVKPSNLFEKKLACIIRAKPGNLPKRKYLKCELIPASEELPYLDKREDYASLCFRLSPRYSDSMLKFDVPWYLSIPFYPLISKDKKPVIMTKNDDLNKWIECVTNEVTFDQIKQDLSFVETRISKPYGTFAVVSSLNKETAIITKEGSQLTCMSDRNVFLSVPPDSLKISINTSLQVSSIDPTFWKEMKEKHSKSPLDHINFASSIVEIEAKKKKLMCAATLTVGLPIDTTKYLDNQKNKTKEVEPENNKTEDDKSILPKKELNPFQKTLLMSIVSSTNQIQDLHLLNYINEEDRWNISKQNNLTLDSHKNQVSLELPILQTSKFILLKSQKHTNEETITKAAKIIENEFCVRNCVIALFQSTNTINEFAFIVSLKKCFQNNSRILQDEGYVLDSNNKLTYVELQERQIITTKFVGNIQNIKPKYNETIFCFHSLFPNIQKFKVREIDSYAQRAVLTFRGYINLYTTSLVKKPIQSTDNKTRKNQIQYTWVEENVMICHLLICISKKKLPPITPFHDFQFKFKNYKNCFALIRVISSKIGLNWWDLGFNLGIPETRMQSIRLQSQDKGLNKMAEVMLTFWLKGCETYENKYELLKAALRNCGRSDIIDRILKPDDSNLIFGC